MGCGHSKISIYPRRNRNKNSSKKSATPEKTESEEEDGVETDIENTENLEDCDQRKTIKVKPFGGPLLAQAEISTSQQDFFRMLDEKIQNGPDYNSESESERAAETARLRALLRDWETASSGSRSLPATPKKRPIPTTNYRKDGVARSASDASQMTNRDIIVTRTTNSANDRTYLTQIQQNIIQQTYGLPQQMQQPPQYRPHSHYNNPNYVQQSPPPQTQQQHHAHHQMTHPSAAMQYQAISPMYSNHPVAYQQPPSVRYYGNYGSSPVKGGLYTGNSSSSSSPKHISYEGGGYSPNQALYGSPVVKDKGMVQGDLGYKSYYANGELFQHQQQFYHHQPSQNRVVMQQQQVQQQQQQQNYQTSVTIPIVVKGNNNGQEINPFGARGKYELT